MYTKALFTRHVSTLSLFLQDTVSNFTHAYYYMWTYIIYYPQCLTYMIPSQTHFQLNRLKSECAKYELRLLYRVLQKKTA